MISDGDFGARPTLSLELAASNRDIRRKLLRRNIAIDAETAQLVADAVQAALQPAAAPRSPRRRPRGAAAGSEPLF